MYKRRTV